MQFLPAYPVKQQNAYNAGGEFYQTEQEEVEVDIATKVVSI